MTLCRHVRWRSRASASATIGVIVASLLGACAGTGAKRTPLQDSAAQAAPVDEQAFVTINGLEQWITIRGDDRSKPVLLMIHGGPGQVQSYLLERMRPLERRFVVVQWDQRGAGRTLAHAGNAVDPAPDLKTMVADGLAVTKLRARASAAASRRAAGVLLGRALGGGDGAGQA